MNKHAPKGDHLVWLLRYECFVPVSEIAERLGISRTVVNSYLKGVTIPSKARQKLMLKILREEINALKDYERHYVERTRVEWMKFTVAKQEMLEDMFKHYGRTL
jgi:transcriptional regulator with XRE-family HTH domain